MKETRKHIIEVRLNLLKLITALQVRSWEHDQSKLEEPEASGFAKVTDNLKGLTYGSEEYKTQLKEMKPFLDHHYENNRHHPEHFTGFYKCPRCGDICHKNGICVMCMPIGETVEPFGIGETVEPFGIGGMDLIDLCEMLMDWWAATKRHADGDIMKSIEINQKRFGYSEELKQIFINTIKTLNGVG